MTVGERCLSPSSVEDIVSHYSLCAEILSYIVYDTRDLARLRLISSSWNCKVFPFVLKSATGLIRNCYHTDRFFNELVSISDIPSPSHWQNLGGCIQADTIFNEGGHIEAIITIDVNPIEPVTVTGDTSEFPALAKTLCQTKSKSEFDDVATKALAAGMFFSVEEFDNRKTSYEHISALDAKLGYCHCFAALITLTIPLRNCPVIDRRTGSCATVFFHGTGFQDLIVPFDILGTYRGYTTIEEETVDDVTCIIPVMIGVSYDLMDILEEEHSGDVLQLSFLLSKTQESLLIPEGVVIADGALPEALHESLMKQINDLANGTEADYHPNSKRIVRDLVHPSLYPYVKGVSNIRQLPVVPPAKFDHWLPQDGHSTDVLAQVTNKRVTDYWGRTYEASSYYQWLPTYFDIGMDGSCVIEDYINNLVPRQQYEPLYENIAKLFSHALPLLESVFSYTRVVRQRIRHDNDIVGFDDSPILPVNEKYHSLRGKKLQVISKIVDYELHPGQTYEGVWHVEGMSHEEIVCTSIYFIHRDKDIVGGDILFKRAFHKPEARFIFSNVNQCRPQHLESVIEEGLLPLGKVETLPKRFIVFPNCHLHKVTEMENMSIDVNDTQSILKRRIIVFFLVNPEKRITSTREVPPQQMEHGGGMTLEEARKHRMELMKERKYTKQDWNVREIQLCEH